MSTFKHLSPNTREFIDAPKDERIRKVRKHRWIGYTKANQIISQLNDLLDYPTSPRMPNALIIGATNNGKTDIIRKFEKLHPADPNIGGEAMNIPVLSVQAPPGPSEAGFYNAILRKLFIKTNLNENPDKKRDKVIGILKEVNLGLIIIDEIHHLIAGSTKRQKNFLNVIKYLGNELCVPIVGVGTQEAFIAMQSDEQLQNRFKPVILPKWEYNNEFAKLLMSFERILPLSEPSNLSNKAIARKILGISEGAIGEISELINEAAIYAIKNDFPRITEQCLEKCDYLSPYNRKNALNILG